MQPELVEITIAATAGNVAATYTNSTGKAIEILYGRVTMVTNASVANRVGKVEFQTPAGVALTSLKAGAPVTASLTTDLNLSPGMPRETAIANNALQMTLPNPGIIPAGGKLVTSFLAGVAGDSFSGKFLARAAKE